MILLADDCNEEVDAEDYQRDCDYFAHDLKKLSHAVLLSARDAGLRVWWYAGYFQAVRFFSLGILRTLKLLPTPTHPLMRI